MDALKYDSAIATLKKNENNLAVEINHQISLSKQWVSRSSNVTDRIVENQGKIEKIINSILDRDARHEDDMINYGHLAQLLLIIGDDIDNLSMQFLKLENLLGFIKAKSIHHSVLNYDTYKSMISRLDILYNKEEILEISFRDYYDLIKLGYYYKGNDIFLIVKFPIVRPTNYILYRLSLAPNHDNKILSPTYPFVAIHEKDLLSMETECPKYSHGHLCEDNPSHHNGDQKGCIQELLLRQHIHESCHFTTVILSSEAMEQLDDHHYVMSFPNLTKVRLTCSEDQYRMLQGSYLAVIPKGCALHTSALTASNHQDQIKGRVLKIMDISVNEEKAYKAPVKRTIKLNTIDLSHLHSSNSKIALQEPVTFNSGNSESIYHTTIPVYSLFGAAALVIIVLLWRKMIKSRTLKVDSLKLKEVYSKKEEESGHIEIKDGAASIEPVHPISALFSTLASK